jgi:hypothetical protein
MTAWTIFKGHKQEVEDWTLKVDTVFTPMIA